MTNMNPPFPPNKPPGFHKGGLIPGKTIVISEQGCERLVLEAGDTSFLTSTEDDFEETGLSYTYKQAERYGWQIKEEPKTVKYSNQEHWEEVAKTKEKIKAFEEWLDTYWSIDRETVKAKVKELFGINP